MVGGHVAIPELPKALRIAAETASMTKRDDAILETLTKRVRVLSVSQVADTWWGGQKTGVKLAKARLFELERRGMVQLLAGLARPLPKLTEPVMTWTVGDPTPDFGSVSYRLRSRWTLPARRTLVAVATADAGSRFAGKGGRVPRASELTHDLCLAGVYLKILATDPRRAKAWVSEASLYERGEGRNSRLPDAAIVTRARRTVIEFGGAYPPGKVADFHRYCEQHGWGYELW